MMIDDPKRRLGRGLSALLGDEEGDYADLDKALGWRTVPVESLRPGKFQPRHNFDSGELEALADSIREKGVLQPIVVRRHSGDNAGYEIIAGERRWRAAQLARLHEVPVIVRELSDKDALEIALIENLQRENLNAIEEAQAYQKLLDDFSHTQDLLAKTVGRSRSHVANTLRLLSLPDGVQAMIETGELTAGHARTVIGAADPEGLARVIVAKGLNVRQAEKLAKSGLPPTKPRRGRRDKDSDTLALERDVSNALGLMVTIRSRNDDRHAGTLSIDYQSLDQLDDVLQRLSRGASSSVRGVAVPTDGAASVQFPVRPDMRKQTI
jgi:ParB family chromosome partitioning protein